MACMCRNDRRRPNVSNKERLVDTISHTGGDAVDFNYK